MACSVDLTSFGLLFDNFIRSAMSAESSAEYLYLKSEELIGGFGGSE